MIRAVLDTSALFSPRSRRQLQEAAAQDLYKGIWSPWIIAELNRVLVWRWIRQRAGGDTSPATEREVSGAAKVMMEILLPTFELVAPLPPYPPAWPSLTDVYDYPIWAAAVVGPAGYVVSENTRHYPPRQPDVRYRHDGVEYMRPDAFLDMILDA